MTYLSIFFASHYAFVIVSLTWLAYFLQRDYLSYKFTRFFIYFLFPSDEGPMLDTLDHTIRIGSTPTFLYFYLELDWFQLDWFELDWFELEWFELDWFELRWFELDSFELDWFEIGCFQLHWFRLHLFELDWFGLDWFELDWFQLH